MLLSLDPGSSKKGALACSLWSGSGAFMRAAKFKVQGKTLSDLKHSAWVQVYAWLDTVATRYEVACEEMVYYPQRGSAKASSEIAHLLHLAGIAGYIAGRLGAVSYDYPARVWKKQLPKAVCHERMRGVLTPEELARLDAYKSLDIWDSAGIGLYHLGRFRP